MPASPPRSSGSPLGKISGGAAPRCAPPEIYDAELDRLRRQYPRWRIWRGRATGDYWAMPPRGHPAARELISASDIGEFARRLARAEERRGRR